MATTMSTATARVAQASALGTGLPPRRTTNHATMTMASATHPMSSWVMPDVMCPKPLKMRSQCSRWKNTAIPPAASSTADTTHAGTCARFPTPNTAIRACVPNSPALHATSVVKMIKGHCNSMVYPLHFRSERSRYMSSGPFSNIGQTMDLSSVYGSTYSFSVTRVCCISA